MDRAIILLALYLISVSACINSKNDPNDVEWTDDIALLSKYLANTDGIIEVDSANWFIWESCNDCIGRRAIMVALIFSKTDSFPFLGLEHDKKHLNLESKYLDLALSKFPQYGDCFVRNGEYYSVLEEYRVRDAILNFGYRGIWVNCEDVVYLYAWQNF